MVNMQERLEAAVAGAETDVSKLHNIVHGNDNAVILTDGGEVPSIAKQIKDTDAAIKSGVAGTVAQAEAARDAAVTAKTAAQSAQSAALVSANNAATSETNAHNSEVAAGNYAAAANVAKINWLGNWASGIYNTKDAVYKDGTSYIANKTTSQTPSTSATDWNILALKGIDGTGAGDLSSNTAISVDGEVALFSGTSGKLIKRGNGITGIGKFINGVLSAAQASDFPTLNQNTTGSSASCTGNAATATSANTAAACSGNAATATKATNLNGGAAGRIPYQSAANATSFIAVGTSGYFLKSNGAAAPSWEAISQSLVKQVRYETGTRAVAGSSRMYFDNTIPQNTEGNEVMTLAITPASASNILVIDVIVSLYYSVNDSALGAALFQDSNVNALAAVCHGNDYWLDVPHQLVLRHYMAAGTTAATTFKVRIGSDLTANIMFNGTNGGQVFGGVMASSIVITEYAA